MTADERHGPTAAQHATQIQLRGHLRGSTPARSADVSWLVEERDRLVADVRAARDEVPRLNDALRRLEFGATP